MDVLSFWLSVLILLGSALIGGVFFIFSNTIMKSLAQRPAPEGMAVMQAINVVIINPGFLGAFMGTAAASLLLIVVAFLGETGLSKALVITSALAYFVGTFLVTIAGNVPLNNALARADSDSPDGQAVWADYLQRWTRLNTLRTVFALIAASFLLAALIAG